MLSSKKAQEGMSLNAVIGVILSVVSILVLSGIAFMIAGLFMKSNQDLDSNYANFKELSLLVENIINKREDNIHIERFPLYLAPGYTIIGFDKSKDYIETNKGSKLYKPSKCRSRACLCLYYNAPFYGETDYDDITTKNDGVVECKRYPDDITFFSRYRENERGHPDSIGDERSDISIHDVRYDFEYFIVTGKDSSFKFLASLVSPTIWRVTNIEIIKRVDNKENFIEISAIPDEGTLWREELREYSEELLEELLDTPLYQDIDALTFNPQMGGQEAEEFLRDNPDIYQSKTYEEFIKELYNHFGSPEELTFDEKDKMRLVFTSVTYSMFWDKIKKNDEGFPVSSGIFIDYPRLEDVSIGDFVVQLGVYGRTPEDLLVGQEIYLDDGWTANIIFFTTDMVEQDD